MTKLSRRKEAYMYFIILLTLMLWVVWSWKVALIEFLLIGLCAQVVRFVVGGSEE